jgi:hypothetical protein
LPVEIRAAINQNRGRTRFQRMRETRMATPPEQLQPDPVFLQARKEAVIIFTVWVLCLLWTIPYCYFNGFVDEAAAAEVSTVLGVPSWAFWGIGAPWILADVFTIWFCLFYMRDADLGEEQANDDHSSPQRGEHGG